MLTLGNLSGGIRGIFSFFSTFVTRMCITYRIHTQNSILAVFLEVWNHIKSKRNIKKNLYILLWLHVRLDCTNLSILKTSLKFPTNLIMVLREKQHCVKVSSLPLLRQPYIQISQSNFSQSQDFFFFFFKLTSWAIEP